MVRKKLDGPRARATTDKTRKALLTQWGTRNSGACLKAH